MRSSRVLRSTYAGLGTVCNHPAIYDAHVVAADVHQTPGGRDGRILLGIGNEGQEPAVFLELCPADGVEGLIDDLRRAQAEALPHHRNCGH